MFAPDSLPLKIIRKIPLCLSFGLIIIKYYNWSRIYALRNLHEKFILRRHTFVLTLFEILKCDIFTFVCESVHCSESMKKLFGKVCNGICSNIRVRLKILARDQKSYLLTSKEKYRARRPQKFAQSALWF